MAKNHLIDKNIFLSVVIPAYNEDSRIGSTLERIRNFLDSQDYSSEIVLVSDGCSDNTDKYASETLAGWPNFNLLCRSKNMGKGYSVREGVLNSRGRYILFSDADLSTPIEELERFLPWIEKYDLVIGSRALDESDIQVHQSFLRESMGKTFNVLVKLFALKGIKDTQCGFKLFTRRAALDIFRRVRISGFAFDVEVLYIARKCGYTLKQLPVVWRNSPQSRVHVLRSSLEMIRDLFRIRSLHKSEGKFMENHGR